MKKQKTQRKKISAIELFEMFPDEAAARKWFEETRWPNKERYCPRCGSMDGIKEVPNTKPMPYWCSGCRSYFSVKTGTAMEKSNLPLRKWVIALYLMTTNLKGVSSTRLGSELKIRQSTAWFMAHRIRTAWEKGFPLFAGPVEVDESYFGGKRKNMNKAKREKLCRGRGPVDKAAVVGIKDRKTKKIAAAMVGHATSVNLQGFVKQNVEDGATVYTDNARAYETMPNRQAVNHSAGEYVRGMAHTNGIESFWSMLKRGYYGTYHKMSVKHLDRYVQEFAGRHNVRDLDTAKQMVALAYGMCGKRLKYNDLVGGRG